MSDAHTVFAIFLNRLPGQVTHPEAIAAHITHIRSLDDRGLLVLSGPFKEYPGGLVVVRADSLAQATAIAESDPFVALKLRTYEVREWLLANRENEYRAKG